MENRVVLVDEYDQIHSDLLPFHSLPVSEFRRRASSLQTDPRLPWHAHSFGLGIKDGVVSPTPGSAGKGGSRVEDLLDLLGEFSELLPDMEVRFSEGDEPAVVISGEAKERHLEYAKDGKGASSSFSLSLFLLTDCCSNSQSSVSPPLSRSSSQPVSPPGTPSALLTRPLDDLLEPFPSILRAGTTFGLSCQLSMRKRWICVSIRR
jgi:hypothetical protein